MEESRESLGGLVGEKSLSVDSERECSKSNTTSRSSKSANGSEGSPLRPAVSVLGSSPPNCISPHPGPYVQWMAEGIPGHRDPQCRNLLVPFQYDSHNSVMSPSERQRHWGLALVISCGGTDIFPSQKHLHHPLMPTPSRP